MGSSSSSSSQMKSLKYFLLFSWLLLVVCYCSNEEDEERDDDDDSLYTVDSFTYSQYLHHNDWTYIKVELPSWFTYATISIVSDIDLDLKMMNSSDKSEVPIVCVRDGGPPLPDVSQTSFNQLELVLGRFFNGSFHDAGDCYALQKNMELTITNYQILPGYIYVGFFNGIGPIRTQSKMINRGSAYSFTATVTVVGCRNEPVSGPNCNQKNHQLSCSATHIKGHHEQAQQLTCKNNLNETCQHDFEPKLYSLNIEAQQFIISARKIKLRGVNKLMGYARYGAVPRENVYDFKFDLSDGPLKIQSPKIGLWYLLVQPVGNFMNVPRERGIKVCYSLEWKVFTCPQGKAGKNNCPWQMHFLKDHRTEDSVNYLPYHGNMSFESINFSLETLLSKNDASGLSWTYFLLYVLDGFSGANLHIEISSDQNIDYELYVRYRGIPSSSKYDYFYSNQTSNSDNSSMFKLYDSSEKSISVYLLYPKEGPWFLGLRHNKSSYKNNPSPQMKMCVSIKSCPNQCSGHGKCNLFKNNQSSSYGCECDINHGGFDCSIELVSRAGYKQSRFVLVHIHSSVIILRTLHFSFHIYQKYPSYQKWHAIALIASNMAAMFPAFWALRQKAFAEWVIFMCSGLASGLYHSCDVAIWCVLDYTNIQFMDFWLSYMAVVSTFVFLTVINESAKRTIHTVAWIVTALMTLNGPTKPRNMVLVPVIGALGLIIGWLIEFLSTSESKSESFRSYLYILERWQNVKEFIFNVVKAIYQRFRWWFILAGFVALGVAAIGWTAETSQTYWIWHSVWHVSIYISSFFFLCSKAYIRNGENYRVVEEQASSVPSSPIL